MVYVTDMTNMTQTLQQARFWNEQTLVEFPNWHYIKNTAFSTKFSVKKATYTIQIWHLKSHLKTMYSIFFKTQLDLFCVKIKHFNFLNLIYANIFEQKFSIHASPKQIYKEFFSMQKLYFAFDQQYKSIEKGKKSATSVHFNCFSYLNDLKYFLLKRF